MKGSSKHIAIILSILVLAVLLAGCGGSSHPPVWQPESTIPVTGPQTADSARIDARVIEMMKKYDVPGMSLAITKNGRLLYARGYGYADREAGQKMQPDSRGRIGSIGKTLTAVALLHLVEEGKLNLDTPFVNILTQYPVPANADARIKSVTVRQIMHHTAGWDTSISGDVEMMSTEIAKALGVPEPTDCGDWIRYKLGKPLDFEPGSKYSYSNFGYCVMSRVIEKVTGKKYYEYLREDILAHMGIADFVTAYTLESQRQPREVKYYDYPGAPLLHSILPPHDSVPAPYGWAQMEALEGIGGWIASAIDLTHFINHLDGSHGAQFLTPAIMKQFFEDPHVPGIDGGWYGLGIVASNTPQGLYWTHNGGCPGTMANVAHRPDGYDWAMVLNSRAKDSVSMFNEIAPAIENQVNSGLSDSGADLYEQFLSTL